MEHRWGHRWRVILPVRLDGTAQTAALGWLTDISLSGGYVRTAAALAIMSHIHIEVDESGGGATRLRPLLLQGRVARHGPAGIGVEWEEFATGRLGKIFRIAKLNHRHGIHQPFEVAPDAGWRTLPTHDTPHDADSCLEP
jgi:hypothetical protein